MAATAPMALPLGQEPWPPRARLIVFLLALFIMLAFGDKAILGLLGLVWAVSWLAAGGAGPHYYAAPGTTAGNALAGFRGKPTAVGGLALLAMSRLGAGWPLLAAMAVALSSGPALTPLANAAIADVCPPAQRSGVLATAHALGTTGSVAAPFASGLIVDLAPTESAGFAAALDLAGVLLLGGAALAATVIRPDRDAARAVG